MTGKNRIANLAIEPLEAIAFSDQDAALAIICGVEGPSYRPMGASMAVFKDGTIVGTLSSGCIEADIANHAVASLSGSQPHEIRYGRGSPFMDIKLPCGGGLDVLLIPRPELGVLQDVTRRHARRELCCLSIDTETGKMSVVSAGRTARTGSRFTIQIAPEPRFLTFGAGPEALAFASIIQSIGFPNEVFSPDRKTLEQASYVGCKAQHLLQRTFPNDLCIDDWTAVTMFFHDHDWEPPLLAEALQSPAFYIGAQGSKRAAAARLIELEALNVDPCRLSRLHGPIGLIPSARDAHTLAVSVLAEILAEYGAIHD